MTLLLGTVPPNQGIVEWQACAHAGQVACRHAVKQKSSTGASHVARAAAVNIQVHRVLNGASSHRDSQHLLLQQLHHQQQGDEPLVLLLPHIVQQQHHHHQQHQQQSVHWQPAEVKAAQAQVHKATEHGIGQRQQQQCSSRRQSLKAQSRAKRSSYDTAAAMLMQQLKAASDWTHLVHLVEQYQPGSMAQHGFQGSMCEQQQQHVHCTAQQPQLLLQQQQQQNKELMQLRQQRQLEALSKLNPQHLSCLLSCLVRLQPPPGPSLWASEGTTPATAATAATATPPSASRSAAPAAVAVENRSSCIKFAKAIFTTVSAQLPNMQPRQLSNIMWAAAKLDCPPTPAQVRAMFARMTEPSVLAQANAQDLAMCLYSVAAMGVQVAEEQLGSVLEAVMGQLAAPNAQAVSNTLWAVATLQYRPTEQWFQAVEAACSGIMQAQLTAGLQHMQQAAQGHATSIGFCSKGLHQLLWSMAKLQWVPTAQFQGPFWVVSGRLLPTMTPHGTSGLLWAAASLELQPPAAWLTLWFSVTLDQLQQQQFQAQDMGNTLWALARLGVKPPLPTHSATGRGPAEVSMSSSEAAAHKMINNADSEAAASGMAAATNITTTTASIGWLSAAIAASADVLPAAGTQELANMLWGFAKLGCRPGQPWMAVWLASLQHRMHSFCAPALASSTYALALLRYKPHQPWLHTLLCESQRQMAAFGAQELANLIWALAVLRIRPSRLWLEDFQVQVLAESGSFNGQETALLLWSLAKLGHAPPANWVVALLQQCMAQSGGLGPQEVSMLLEALSRWQLPELTNTGKHRKLLMRCWAAVEPLLPACHLHQLSVLLWACVRLGCMPSSSWRKSFWAAATPALGAATALFNPAAAGKAAGNGATASTSSTTTAGLGFDADSMRQQSFIDTAGASGSQAAVSASSNSRLSPAAVVRLVWASGKLCGQVPAQSRYVLLQAAKAVVPLCNLSAVTALGLGCAAQYRAAAGEEQPGTDTTVAVASAQQVAAARNASVAVCMSEASAAPAAKIQAAPAPHCIARVSTIQAAAADGSSKQHPSAAGVLQQGCTRWVLSQEFWDLWFTRSTQLLQQPQQLQLPQLQQQQQQQQQPYQPQWTWLQPAYRSVSGAMLQQQQQQRQLTNLQQQQQPQCNSSGKDALLQLAIAAQLDLQPPADWCTIVSAEISAHLPLNSLEQLSWLMWAVLKLKIERQLPAVWLNAVLDRCCSCLQGGTSSRYAADAGAVFRLHRALRRMQRYKVLSKLKWQAWVVVYEGWLARQEK